MSAISRAAASSVIILCDDRRVRGADGGTGDTAKTVIGFQQRFDTFKEDYNEDGEPIKSISRPAAHAFKKNESAAADASASA